MKLVDALEIALDRIDSERTGWRWFFWYHLVYRWRRDECSMCNGVRGGVRGNENIINTVVTYTGPDGKPHHVYKRIIVCDLCHADKFWGPP